MVLNLNQIMSVIFNVPAAVFSTVGCYLFLSPCTVDTAVIPRSLLVAQCAVLQTSPMMDHRCCTSYLILPRTPIDCLFLKQQYDFWTPFQKWDYYRGTVCKLQVIAAWCPRSGRLITQPNRTRLSD